jgi:hypothetical protein
VTKWERIFRFRILKAYLCECRMRKHGRTRQSPPIAERSGQFFQTRIQQGFRGFCERSGARLPVRRGKTRRGERDPSGEKARALTVVLRAFPSPAAAAELEISGAVGPGLVNGEAGMASESKAYGSGSRGVLSSPSASSSGGGTATSSSQGGGTAPSGSTSAGSSFPAVRNPISPFATPSTFADSSCVR